MKKGEIISLGIFLISAFILTSLLVTDAPEDVPPVCKEGYEYEASTQLCLLITTEPATTQAPITTEVCTDEEYLDHFGTCRPIPTPGGDTKMYLSFIPSDSAGQSVLFVMLVFMAGNWYIWGRKLFSRG